MPARSIVVATALAGIERQVIKRARNAIVHPVFINIKAKVERLAAGIDLAGAVDVRISIPARSDVQRDAIERPAALDRGQGLIEVLHPVERIASRGKAIESARAI